MKIIQTFALIWLTLLCAIFMIGINMTQYMILNIPFIASDNVSITAANHDDFSILSREYKKVSDSINPLVVPEKVVSYKISNSILRSIDNDVYILEKKDDAKFPDVPKYKLDSEKYNWAINGCKNNATGCDVKVIVKYKFGDKKSKFPTLMRLRYSVKMTINR